MITSPQNDKLKEIRRLNRRHEARFVAEGEDLVEAAERAGWPAVYRLEAGIDVEPALLDDVSALGSGTRVIAVYERRYGAPAGPLCVALWGVRDPGNVGAVLRSALAFGASSVALGPDCADPFAPKAVRASMGALFAVPVARVSDPAELPGRRIGLAARAGEPLPVALGNAAGDPQPAALGTSAGDPQPAARGTSAGDQQLAALGTGAGEPQPVALGNAAGDPVAQPTTILVGAERTGLPDDVLAACDTVAHIPIATDSLNAAMAATVALYEVRRAAAVTAGAEPPGAEPAIARVGPS